MIGGASLRRATLADAPALAELGAATFTQTFGHLYRPDDLGSFVETSYAPSAYEEFIRDPETASWIAESADGKPLGYAMAGPCDLPVDDMPARAGELKRIYLLEEAQGAGLGKALLEAVLEWLETRFDHVYLGVYFENFRAQEIYRRYGFEKVGEYHFMVGNHADPEWIMKKAAPRA
jgi:diamine N-acetyltransferase